MIKVNGRPLPWKPGMTVGDLLRELGDPYPYAVVRIDGKTVSRPNFDKVLVPDDSELYFVPMIAGG